MDVFVFPLLAPLLVTTGLDPVVHVELPLAKKYRKLLQPSCQH
jgi:hypothetical protein